jgi:DNA-directed RNA polymerase specialized sigma subunit
MVKTFSKKDIHENLRQVMNLNLQINTKSKELSQWREISESASGISYSHAKSGRKIGSRIEDCIIKIDAIEQAIKNDVENLMLLKARISQIIDRISDPACKSLLSLRYLSGMSWEEVAEFMDYSYVHIVHRLHPKALEKFGDAYKSQGGSKNSKKNI